MPRGYHVVHHVTVIKRKITTMGDYGELHTSEYSG